MTLISDESQQGDKRRLSHSDQELACLNERFVAVGDNLAHTRRKQRFAHIYPFLLETFFLAELPLSIRSSVSLLADSFYSIDLLKFLESIVDSDPLAERKHH